MVGDLNAHGKVAFRLKLINFRFPQTGNVQDPWGNAAGPVVASEVTENRGNPLW
jgi:hypothetical protein